MIVDVIAMIVALIVMAATIVVKIVTHRVLVYKQHWIDKVNRELQDAHHELGLARARKDTALKNKAALERKKSRVLKKIGQFRKEMQNLRAEEAHRREMRDTARGILTRSSENLFDATAEASEEEEE